MIQEEDGVKNIPFMVRVDVVTEKCSTKDCLESATCRATDTNTGKLPPKYCETHRPEDAINLPIVSDEDIDIDFFDSSAAMPSVKNIFFAMIGRLFYDVGEMDNWQVIGFLKGLAQTGKSTIIKAIQKFYSTEDVHVLSNNNEHKFGLEPIMSKFLFLAPEITSCPRCCNANNPKNVIRATSSFGANTPITPHSSLGAS